MFDPDNIAVTCFIFALSGFGVVLLLLLVAAI